MNRFFISADNISDTVAVINGDDVKHITKVLRMGVGDEALLCDGKCREYHAKISEISRAEVRFDILSADTSLSEPTHKITLYQGLPKAGKMELIIQKCVELGVCAIVPVLAERSVVRHDEKSFAPKLERYRRVAYEAAKQSGRGAIPEVRPLCTFKNCGMSKHELILIAYEDELETTLKSTLRAHADVRDIAVVIGPEGGLERAEVELMQSFGGIAVTLGRRILRTETAGMAALAMILYELED